MDKTRKFGKFISKVFWTLMLGLIAIDGLQHLADRVDAQGLTAGGSRVGSLPGIQLGTNEFGFTTPNGSAHVPIRFSFYRDGIPEPTAPNVMWFHMRETDGQIVFTIKCNYFGTPMIVHQASFEIQ